MTCSPMRPERGAALSPLARSSRRPQCEEVRKVRHGYCKVPQIQSKAHRGATKKKSEETKDRNCRHECFYGECYRERELAKGSTPMPSRPR